MVDTAAYIVRETRLSMAINAALSMGIYLLFFGTSDSVRIWGVGGFAFDFAPQSFAITLMSVLVPGAMTRRKLAAGRVAPLARRSVWPERLASRALLLAVIAAVTGGGLAAAALATAGVDTLAWSMGGAIKVGYGALLAWVVTPIGLKATLRCGAPAHS